MQIPRSKDLSHALLEAKDISDATDQPLTTAHLLLAFFTAKNRAETLLKEHGIDEDRLLDLVEPPLEETAECLAETLDRAERIAAGCGAREVDCLHALVSMSRARGSCALLLLAETGEPITKLRTHALSILTDAIPRWSAEEEPEELESAVSHVRRASRPARKSVRSDLPRPGMSSAIEWTPPIIRRPERRSPPVRKPVGLLDPTKKPRTVAPDKPASARNPRPEPRGKASAPPVPEPVMEPKSVPARPVRPDPAARYLLSAEDFPWLTSLGRNLSAEAARAELEELEGRDQEIAELIDVLGKRRTNNPCLLGEPGVGKTAVVESLAWRLVHSPPSPALGDRIIIELDVGSLLIGTHLRGSFSEKLQGLKEEVKDSGGRVIIFFDELHTLVGAGAAGDGAMDAANELKAAFARGEFPCIGATTLEEWRKHIEPDSALKRRFQPVLVKEPTHAEALRMLKKIAPAYAAHHGVEFDEEALRQAVSLSARFIVDRHLPDKAVALLDLAGSRAARAGERRVTEEHIGRLVAERAGIPIERVLASDRERLLNLEAELAELVVGHRDAVTRIANVVRRNAAGFGSHRPQGSFLFLGPTGVGKTETAKALAILLHGSLEALVRFDLSEFSEGHSVARLLGAPPGYVGHDAGGQLTELVRKRPAAVLLFDEIEKAHRDVLQIFLQILDDGRLTDGHGRTVSFAECIIVMTSNVGADLYSNRRIGFEKGGAEAERELETRVLDRAKRELAPELWARIEERLVFHPLEKLEVREVTRRLAEASSRRLEKERGIGYSLDDGAVDFLVEQGGYDSRLGARPMRHVLSRIVEAPIAARILEGRIHADEHVYVSTRPDGTLAFLVGEDRTSLSQRPRR